MIADLAFLPLLAVLVMIPLLRSKNRNTPLLIVLGALWFTNLVFHVALIHRDAPLAQHCLIVGIDVVYVSGNRDRRPDRPSVTDIGPARTRR